MTIKSLSADSLRVKGEIYSVHLLGQDTPLVTTRDGSGLTVTLPATNLASSDAPLVLKIALKR